MKRPPCIFAARSTPDHDSSRPRDTVRPLARALGLSIDTRWSDADEPMHIAQHLIKVEAPALVCWRHDSLPALGKALARALLDRDDMVPTSWPAARYDLVWSFEDTADAWRFRQVPQMLLASDRPGVIDVTA